MCYQSPDDEAGNFDSSHVVRTLRQQQSNSIDDDQQMLLDIEQNIANLEKSLNKGDGGAAVATGNIAAGRSSFSGNGGGGGSSKPNILKRVMSSGSASLHEKSQYPAAKHDKASSVSFRSVSQITK